MDENNDSTPLTPGKRKPDGKWTKGICPNPKGRGKGALSKTTKFLQVMTSSRQKRALKVLDKVLSQAEKGDGDSQKMVLTLIQPFLKREAEQGGGAPVGDRRPMVNVIVQQADGLKPVTITPRVIESGG